MDRLARNEKIEAELDERVVTGSRGQVAMHAITKEIRDDTSLLIRLLEQLNMPDEADEFGVKAATKRAQKAANARWGRGEAS
jgi:hypothetical protein